MDLNINYRLWVTMICQYSFINSDKHTTLEKNDDSGEVYACFRSGSIKGVYTSCSISVWDQRTLKKLSIFKMCACKSQINKTISYVTYVSTIWIIIFKTEFLSFAFWNIQIDIWINPSLHFLNYLDSGYLGNWQSSIWGKWWHNNVWFQ